MRPEVQAALQALLDTATEAGITCILYPGGTLLFSPAECLRQFPALAADLRASRDALARYLRTVGPESATDTRWLEYYRMWQPPVREGQYADLIPF